MESRQFCSETDTKAEILVIYESKSDLLTTTTPPIYLDEYLKFVSPAWVKYGQRAISAYDSEVWVDFTTLPAGYSFDDFYWGDRINGKARYVDINLPSGANERRVYYYNDQVVCDVILQPQYYTEDYQFCDTPDYYEDLLNLWIANGRNIVVTGNFQPSPTITAADIYDSTYSFFYSTKTNLGAYRYDVSCGSCGQGTFPVNDGTKDICVPYEDIINWSKQQRQRLNQIARQYD